jgi:methionine-rich copper-binding protein CopC
VRQTLISAFFVLTSAAIATQAQAHALLEKTVPPVNGTVAASPHEIRLTFGEGVEPRLSGIVLSDAAGEKVAAGKPTVDPNDESGLVVPLPRPLAPGVYGAARHAVPVDTPKTTFTVRP